MHVLIYQENIANSDEMHLRWCVESIRKQNPAVTIVRFGDARSNNSICKSVDSDKYSDNAHLIDKIYTHGGECDRAFQWRSIKRWMVFADYCRKEKVHSFFHCDSDVLVFCDLESESQRLNTCHVSLLKPSDHCEILTLGCCYVHQMVVLSAFEDWLFNLFSHPDSDHYHYVYSQTISDMWLWTCFFKWSPQYTWNDLMIPHDNAVYDPNLCIIDRWENDGKSKVFHFERGVPYGVYKGQKTRLNCLHCWGPWKTRMKELWGQSLK